MDWARVVNAIYTSYVQENGVQSARKQHYLREQTSEWTRKANLDIIFVVGKSKVRLDVKNLAGVSRKACELFNYLIHYLNIFFFSTWCVRKMGENWSMQTLVNTN
jgi:hypothetical protein